jgi:hypothetical protein
MEDWQMFWLAFCIFNARGLSDWGARFFSVVCLVLTLMFLVIK